MVFFDIGDPGDSAAGEIRKTLVIHRSWWLYLALTIPLTVIVILVWALLLWSKGLLVLKATLPWLELERQEPSSILTLDKKINGS